MIQPANMLVTQVLHGINFNFNTRQVILRDHNKKLKNANYFDSLYITISIRALCNTNFHRMYRTVYNSTSQIQSSNSSVITPLQFWHTGQQNPEGQT